MVLTNNHICGVVHRWRPLKTAESEIARFHFECHHSQKKMISRDFASKSRDFIFLTCKVSKWAKAKSRDFILNTKYSLKLEWNLLEILRLSKCFKNMYLWYSLLIPPRKHTYVSLISYFSIIYWTCLLLFLWKFFRLLKYHIHLIVK